MTALWWVAPAVVLTAALSGVFGMAGGMVLMGVYAALLPVREAMILHAVTQLASNGTRAWLLRRDVQWSIIGRYGVGAMLAVAVFAVFTVVVHKYTLLILLGAAPLLARLVPSRWLPQIESRGGAVVTGTLVTALHVTAGVSGPLLDLFFVRTQLARHAVVGTKAVTQVLGHLIKLAYFGALVGEGPPSLWPGLYPAVVGLAFVGTGLGKMLLDRLDDQRFRRWSGVLVVSLGVVYLLRGVWGYVW